LTQCIVQKKFEASAMRQVRIVLVWVIVQWLVVIFLLTFGTIYQFHPQGLHNNTEVHSSQEKKRLNSLSTGLHNIHAVTVCLLISKHVSITVIPVNW